mgnify:CR=1 FL=1
MNKSKFQFQTPFLTKMYFTINNNFSSEEKDVDIKNTMEIGISRKEGESLASVSLSLEIGTNDNSSPFHIDCEIVAVFSWDEYAFDEETVNSLLTMNAPALLLSYIRPLVSQITNMSPFPVYNVPFYNFLPEKNE